MINYKYQLVSPRKIVKKIFDESVDNRIIVKPTYMSICAADQRYFQGKRDSRILEHKLPMALIHEAIGEVLVNNRNFKKGDKVIMIPNITDDIDNQFSNYNINSKFMSSNLDGFMQEKIFINEKQLIKFENIDDEIAVFCELLSVAIHAVNSNIEKINKANKIGIWGDGNLGYLIHLYIAKMFPNKNLYIYGKTDEKLEIFGLATKRINVAKDEISPVDIGFEAVGGNSCSKVINQIIDCINPLGSIVLLGVSEESVNINTRMILEKGITLIGRSRSTRFDFQQAINFLVDENNANSVRKIISSILLINNINDIVNAFDYDFTHPWKTILKWGL